MMSHDDVTIITPTDRKSPLGLLFFHPITVSAMASTGKRCGNKIEIDLVRPLELMAVDAAIRAIVLLSRFAARRAQQIAKNHEESAANAPTDVKSNGYRRKTGKK
jgi:hypothetical protein